VRYLDVQTSRLLLLFGRKGFNKSEGDGLESFLKSIIDDLKGKAVDAESDGMLIKEHTSAATNILNKSIPGRIQLASSDSSFASLVTHEFSGDMDLAEQLKESWQSVVGVSSSENVDASFGVCSHHTFLTVQKIYLSIVRRTTSHSQHHIPSSDASGLFHRRNSSYFAYLQSAPPTSRQCPSHRCRWQRAAITGKADNIYDRLSVSSIEIN
jgi:hypothetical protein